jgi:hypothetical protein
LKSAHEGKRKVERIDAQHNGGFTMATKKAAVEVTLVFDVTPVPESTEREPYVFGVSGVSGPRTLSDGSRIKHLKHLSEYIQSAWEHGGMIVADTLNKRRATYNPDGGQGTAITRTLHFVFPDAKKAEWFTTMTGATTVKAQAAAGA